MTYHGPGQLVAYPILRLRELGALSSGLVLPVSARRAARRGAAAEACSLAGLGVRGFVEALEDVAIDAAAQHGVAAHGRVPTAAGVWVGDRKLAQARRFGRRNLAAGTPSESMGPCWPQVGIRVSGGVSSHGLALNIAPDLSFFSCIVPCGITGKGVTSLAAETGRGVRVDECSLDGFQSAFEGRVCSGASSGRRDMACAEALAWLGSAAAGSTIPPPLAAAAGEGGGGGEKVVVGGG